MKLLVLADIHQRDFKWSKLASAVRKEKPDAVCVAGDLIPAPFLFKHEEFVDNTITKYAKEIKKVCPYLFVIPGNDDHPDLSCYLSIDERSDDLWCNAHNSVYTFNGFELGGIPYVIDHPFGYKYWSVRETNENLKINPKQICKKPLNIIDNKFVDIEDYAKFLMDRPSLETYLMTVAGQVKNMSKAIFLIHCPPIGCGLDLIKTGESCGSEIVARFIMDKQPLLTIHGHIHESPFYTIRWCCQLGRTWAINAGQIENDLYYAVVDIQDDKVVGLRHSIYGEYKI